MAWDSSWNMSNTSWTITFFSASISSSGSRSRHWLLRPPVMAWSSVSVWPMSHPAHTPRKWFTESGL